MMLSLFCLHEYADKIHVMVRLYLREGESARDIASRWVHQESKLGPIHLFIPRESRSESQKDLKSKNKRQTLKKKTLYGLQWSKKKNRLRVRFRSV